MCLLECKEVSKTIGTTLVVDHASFTVRPSETVRLADSENKPGDISPAETLFDMITGDIACHNGQIIVGDDMSFGTPEHLDQLVSGNGIFAEARSAIPVDNALKEKLRTMELSMMYMKNTAYLDLQHEYDKLSKEMREDSTEETDEEIASVLDALGLDEETYLQTVGELDRAGQLRLALAKLILARVDLILLKYPEQYMTDDMCRWAASLMHSRKGALLTVTDQPELFGEDFRTVTV